MYLEKHQLRLDVFHRKQHFSEVPKKGSRTSIVSVRTHGTIIYTRVNVVQGFVWTPTCLSVRTHADEGCNTVYACGALAACSCCTVINVFRAVRSTPTIDAYTDVAARQVAAGTSVLTGVWLQPALIHVLCAVLTCEGGDLKRTG